MSDEKRVKFVVHSDGTIPAAGDIETGCLLQESPQQPERRQCRGRAFWARFFKGFFTFIFYFLLIRAGMNIVRNNGGLRKMWHGCDGMGGDHPHHGPPGHHGPHHGPPGHHGPHHHGDNEFAHVYAIPKPKPFRGAAKWENPYARINPVAMSALVNGKLPATEVSSLFYPSGEQCIPTIPVDGLDKFSFNATEFNSITHRVMGNLGSDVFIESTTDSSASFEAHVMVSDPEIAKDISLTENRDEEGNIVFQLSGPKWLGQSKCAYARIVLKIPDTVTDLVGLRSSFIYGKYKLDKSLARAINFGDFEVNAAVSSIVTPPIHATNVVINTVSGTIHGFYRISSSASVHSVSGKIDVGVNVRKADKSVIVAESVSGSVTVRVAGGFDGSFSARTINGEVEVEDDSDGSNRLHFDKNLSRVKTGTFGPDSNTRAGDSSLKAAVINGDVAIEFE
ncbi:hypothetical protein IW146_006102 [Coemansia sp. RSA 922]|nr:hypothetical protein H4S03_001702 [Coemansia sp. S3946]KAJ2100120.1 hypothetical protein GGI16_003805 [Coemansia sp. S142-1]KAJ2109998.1 hypothetical protein IW146_006102 [Coemansia sp. RSA 922]